MTLISDEYRALNSELHARSPSYGTSGAQWAPRVHALAMEYSARTVLDYGCGKGTLAQSLPEPREYVVTEYDPAVPGKDARPAPADVVVCGDVLEHIEPDCLDDVLDDLRGLTRRAAFLVVATGPAVKTLADGRNAHLIVKPLRWWLPQLHERWDICSLHNLNGGLFHCVAVPHADL